VRKVEIQATFAFQPSDMAGNWLAKVLREARRSGVSIKLSTCSGGQDLAPCSRRKRP
jgi:hypothetical protein